MTKLHHKRLQDGKTIKEKEQRMRKMNLDQQRTQLEVDARQAEQQALEFYRLHSREKRRRGEALRQLQYEKEVAMKAAQSNLQLATGMREEAFSKVQSRYYCIGLSFFFLLSLSPSFSRTV